MVESTSGSKSESKAGSEAQQDFRTWSPFTPAVMQDPAAGHQTLLSNCPVHHCVDFDPPFYTLSRYADVETALRDIETFSSQFGQGPRFTDPLGMLCDPPQHTFMRKLTQGAFTPGAMRALAPQVEALTNQLIDQILDGPKEFDFHDDFAFPLPVVIIAGLLGVPTADLDQFKRWSDIQVAAMGAEDPSMFADEQAAFFAYMQNHLAVRRAQMQAELEVPDDLLSLIAGAAYDDGTLIGEADALSLLMQLLVGGNETTTSLITNMVWRLLETPAHWAEVVQNPDLAEMAIEESLRFDPPVLGLYRNTTREVTLHEVTIPAQAKVWLNYAAANRDASAFPNPDSFDLHRGSKQKRKRHMSFGLGVHFCLGAPMARLEAEIALKTLVQRLPNLQLKGPGERIAPFFLWGRRTLPLAWT
jgi:cytochrome P450